MPLSMLIHKFGQTGIKNYSGKEVVFKNHNENNLCVTMNELFLLRYPGHQPFRTVTITIVRNAILYTTRTINLIVNFQQYSLKVSGSIETPHTVE